ncbi:MAG: hydantoinase/oxoprolinase family protein [Thermodesulfobacteriota bacterium]
MGCTIDIDTGGTFTDGFIVLNGRVRTVKVPTTPHDLTVCFLECLKAGARSLSLTIEDLLSRTEIIRFSNTIGTNCLIQRDGAKIGLLVTAGRESLAPTKSQDGLPPLVFPEMVLGLDEETTPDGRIIKEPDPAAVLTAAQELIDRGARCLVAALANSEADPANERMIRRLIKQEYPRDYLGSVPVFLSSDITFRPGQAQRLNAATLNAYIHAKLARLLYKAEEELRRRHYGRTLFISHNNGAVARVAKTRAINTYNSGPASGLLGARLVGRLYGTGDLISADMGGTSFDVGCVRRGQPGYSLETDVEGFPVNVPMLGIRAIGAGGGSIAWLKDGDLQVGPRSAGALPGPVCFDLGGLEPTVTDADVILGVLDPNHFLGGTMKLNLAKAEAAIKENLADPLGLTPAEAALRIKNRVDRAMGLEIKRIKDRLWPDGDPLLVIYGGAGPAHCCDLARTAGLKRLILTPFSAVFSAFSSSSLDVGHLYYRRLEIPVTDRSSLTAAAEAVEDLKRQAERDMRGEGFSAGQVNWRLELFLRGPGAETEIRIEAGLEFLDDPSPVLDQARSLWRAAGVKDPGPVLILSALGLMAQAPAPHYSIEPIPAAVAGPESARKGSRPVYSSHGFRETPVYDRAGLTHGHSLSGPALVESDHTTLLIQTGWRLTIDQYDNVLLEEVS